MAPGGYSFPFCENFLRKLFAKLHRLLLVLLSLPKVHSSGTWLNDCGSTGLLWMIVCVLLICGEWLNLEGVNVLHSKLAVA